ncbi:MAG: hypothetical protein HYV95_01855 [Opitutae bacterium]|nr:hypothetical protein [Opitutae bacterium]
MVDERLTLASASRWRDTWPDVLAFGAGLALAWQFHWASTDLVWSLWLSSLLVGYAMIVWSIFGPAVFVGIKAWTGRELLKDAPVLPVALGGAAYLVGGLFMLAFFTVHFGMFHFIHSVFLNLFFPVMPVKGALPYEGYLGVLRAYWYFVPLAALSERQAFRFNPVPDAPPDTSVKAADIAARKARNARQGLGNGMMAPYKNVVRMHLLIFFFAFAHFAKIENFLVYAVVYAAYFFPWRVLRKQSAISSQP